MKRFGIISPTLGLQQSLDSILLPEAAMFEAINVRVEDGAVCRVRGRQATLAPPTWNATAAAAGAYDVGTIVYYNGYLYVSGVANNPAAPTTNWTRQNFIHFHWLVKTTGLTYLFGFTENWIFLWNTVTSVWDAKLAVAYIPGGGSELTATTTWSTSTFNDQVVATNTHDVVLVGDNSTAFTALDGLTVDPIVTSAQYVVTYQNYLFLINTTEGAGTAYARRCRWCDIGDAEVWTSTSFVDIGNASAATGGVVWGDFLIIFKTDSIHRMWLTTLDTVFESAGVRSQYGCIAPRSAVELPDGRLAFFASDKTIRTLDGEIISEGIRDTLRDVADNYIDRICAARIDEYRECWWAIPSGANVTANNCVITFHEGRWFTLNMDIVAFASYRTQTTYAIDNLTGFTIDDWDWPTIDTIEATSGTRYDIGSIATGRPVSLHGSNTDISGLDFSGRFSIGTDLASESSNLATKKRVLNLRTFWSSESAEGDIIFQIHNEDGQWFGGFSGTLSGSGNLIVQDVPVDARGRHLTITCEGTGLFRFLGVIFDYIDDGDE